MENSVNETTLWSDCPLDGFRKERLTRPSSSLSSFRRPYTEEEGLAYDVSTPLSTRLRFFFASRPCREKSMFGNVGRSLARQV